MKIRRFMFSMALIVLGVRGSMAQTVSCLGDCNLDEHVTVNELIAGVGVALGSSDLENCGAFDSDADGQVAIGELVGGVNNALERCPSLRTVDPGTAAWQLVPEDRVEEECGLDAALLREADTQLGKAWAVIRHGKLCHEFFPSGSDAVTHVFSATKTLGAVVTGIAAHQTRDIPNTGRKTGPVTDADPVDHWLDSFAFNPMAQISHVLAMVGHNESLAFGDKVYVYDAIGVIQINRLSDILNTAIAQDTDRLGRNLEEFTQKFLFQPVGMSSSVWSNRMAGKIFAYTWNATLHDMARLGLLMHNDGAWNGERILSPDWIYRMTRPAFEDANTAYGYLTWLNASSNFSYGLGFDDKLQDPDDPCSPVALHQQYPHGISESPDCNYEAPYSCEQQFDVGVWYAAGLGGQYIVGHRGLDMVLVGKDFGDGQFRAMWDAMRPALVAHDPMFNGDEEAFCQAYGSNGYAPNLRP